MEAIQGKTMTDKLKQLIIDMKQTFGSEHGKRVLANLEMFCSAHVNQDCFDPESTTKTAYNLGKNRVFRYIKSFVDAQPDAEKEFKETCQTEKPD